jgi:Xaa-Pro aminopeptidase
MPEIAEIQAALCEYGFDGWLLYDFRGSNVLARRVLGFEDRQKHSRRWLYYVPASGEPRKLVHRIEPGALDHLPGEKTVYLRWQELEAGMRSLVAEAKQVAMEFSSRNANPYVSRVDAGVVDLIRSFGCEVVSSGDLVQEFEATWDDDQEQMHFQAAQHTNAAYALAWQFIADRVRAKGSVRELEVQALIMQHFRDHGMTTYSPPIVGVNAHSGDPHFDNSPANDTPMREGDFVLVDLWAKLDRPRAVYSDLTRVGFIGTSVPEKYERIFQIVAAARDAAIERVRTAFAEEVDIQGWEVDEAARDVIEREGYGEYFVHRTGHSIGQETHGNGANMDDLETHEERLILPRTCFSIEPGIYLPEFGIRSEIDVYIDGDRQVHITGGELQTEVVPILAKY